MATGNIDCQISDRICSLQQMNINVFNDTNISDCDDTRPCLSMPSNINTDSFESESIEKLTNDLLNKCARQTSLDSNKNSKTVEFNKSPFDSSKDHYQAVVDDNKNSLSSNNFKPHDSYAIFQAQNAIPEELFINVESDDEGVHSWRPNMSLNALCPDFFVAPSLVGENFNLNFQMPVQHVVEDSNESDGSSSGWTSNMPNASLMLSPKVLPHIHVSNSHPKRDYSNLLRAQVAGLNNVKYETINARRRIAELTDEVQKLTKKLNEKLIVQRTLDVEKLRKENAELRLECQCLCMEVDFYLKGKAPLGEIDENFYVGDSSQMQRNTSTSTDKAEALPKPTDSNSSDDIDDGMKWECCKCTFANHPAINSCEMCQTPRSCRNLPHPASDSVDSCFCHSKRDSS